jgi:multiple sugar transport system substrate-binding protein
MNDSLLPTPTPPTSPVPPQPVVPLAMPVASPVVPPRAMPQAPEPVIPPRSIPDLNLPKVPLQTPIAQAQIPTSPAPPKPAMAKAKKPVNKTIMFAVGLVLLLVAIGFMAFSFFGKSSSKSVKDSNTVVPPEQIITLSYWGLWEPSEVLNQVIKDFETANPEYKIDYRKQSHLDYRERLQTALASGNGPDIYRYHASWVPMMKKELSALPSKVMSLDEFQSTFYPAAYKQLQLEGKIVGIPLMYDGLALYYNKDILRTAGAKPPTTWAELSRLADGLTVPSNKNERSRDTIKRGGLAIGNSTNVEHFSDILALLILQNGGDPSIPTSAEVRDALLFYTKFVDEDQVWSDALPSSTIAFAREEAAMMLAPSWRAHEVKNINPELDFGIATVPQLSDKKIAWASFWAEGVNNKSSNQEAAWEFLKFLSSKENLQKFYSDTRQVRSFGEIYPRKDMALDLASVDMATAYLTDAPYAQGWYLSSYTHDNGINDLLIKYYEDAVTSLLTGGDIEDVQVTLDQGTTQVLRQYSAAK